jgi:nucleoside 2-deoxyribosyltransferase
MDRVAAEQVIRADLAAIDECDVLIADLSAPDWQFVGVIFEMAYASLKGKVVLVYGGSSPIAGRTFIVGTATHVCESWDDVRERVKELLQKG